MEELHHRENDGIAVSLLWIRHIRRLSVIVENRKVGASFAVNARADNALEVFYHPYAHLAAQRCIAAWARSQQELQRRDERTSES